MKLFKKVWNFISKDVAQENETKKVAVIVRLFTLVHCVYFLLQMILLHSLGVHDAGLVCAGFVAINGVFFFFTYRERAQKAAYFVQLTAVIWTLAMVYLMGWSAGGQNFLLLLLVFMMVTNRCRLGLKLLHVLSLCAAHLGLLHFTKDRVPYVQLPGAVHVFEQLLNSFVIYLLMGLIIYLFTKDSNAMEEKLKRYNDKIKHMASIDPLTTLMNRRAMVEYVTKMVEDAGKSGIATSIAICDIDFFKHVNDAYGHEAGDAVLKMVASVFGTFMEDKGAAARWGGEEFLLAFEGLNGDEAYVLVQNLRKMIENSVTDYNGQEIKVTMTFGLEEFDPYKPLDVCVNKADKKLYLGKSSGRNRVVY